jgi:hypothetical protein
METEQTNEVARFQELLNQAIEIAEEYQKHARKNINEDCDWSMHGTHKKFAELQNAITQLAPTPEEPSNPTCSNATHKFSHCDCKELAPEWRELGLDEVIQEGDEVMDIQGNWNQAVISIGITPRNRCTKARRRS